MSLSLSEAKQKMEQALERLNEELKKVRSGRANPAILDGVTVSAYGQPMPLKHLANVVVIDAQLLQITPFDPNNLSAISSAISDSNLGLNPSDDGHIVRVPIPQLNEERRKELVKMLGEKTEEARVVLRNLRHDVIKTAKTQEKDGELSEDDRIRVERDITETLENYNTKIDEAFEHKQSEIMTV